MSVPAEAFARLFEGDARVYCAYMDNTNNTRPETVQQQLARWRAMHPEMTDQEFAMAIKEIQSYLKIAWKIFRAVHKDEDNLPDEL
jgi:hypothetical protein